MIELGLRPPGCTLRLILLRHGEPVPEAHGRCYGRMDVGLSETGRTQIHKKLKLLGSLNAQSIYSSPRKRACESAYIAGEYLGLQPQITSALSEIDFGAFEGLPYEEIERRYPDKYKMWMEHPTKTAFPGGEDFSTMRQRVLGFTSILPNRHANETIMIVSHGGVNRVILEDALGLSTEMIFRISQSYAGLNVIDYFSGHPLVRLMNA